MFMNAWEKNRQLSHTSLDIKAILAILDGILFCVICAKNNAYRCRAIIKMHILKRTTTPENRSVQTVQRSVHRCNRSVQTVHRSVLRCNRSVQTVQRSVQSVPIVQSVPPFGTPSIIQFRVIDRERNISYEYFRKPFKGIEKVRFYTSLCQES
jgi:hypothetical protein